MILPIPWAFTFGPSGPNYNARNSGRWRSYTWGLKLTSAQQYTEIKEQIFLKIEKENTNEYSKDCKLQHAPSARIYSKQNKLAIAYQSCCFIGSWYAAIFLDFYDLTQEPIPELIQNTKALIDAARQSNIPVVYTAQPGNQSPEYRQLLTDFWGPGLKDEPSITQIFPKISPQKWYGAY